MRLRPAAAVLLALALAGLGAAGAARLRLPAAAPAGCVPAAEERLDLNRASERELSALPGLGQTLARRVIRRRKQCGRFTRPEDLLQVKGIGPRKLARWRPWVRLDGQPERISANGQVTGHE